MDCYGQYSNIEPKCRTCNPEIKKYCAESKHPARWHTSLEDIENYSQFADHKNIPGKTQNEQASHSSQQDKLTESQFDISEIFAVLADLSKRNKKAITKNQPETRVKALFEVFDIFKYLYQNSPKTFTILLQKIHSPEKSLSEIGNELGISTQLVDYHIRKPVSKYPILNEGVLMDCRFYSEKVEKKKRTKRRFLVYSQPDFLGMFQDDVGVECYG